MISIIVPVYKVENELRKCVESLINQTYKNIEIILVDDESPDSCPQMCDEFARQDRRVKVIHKKNGGLSDARNYGLKAAQGEYVLFVDSDDYIELDSCERFIEAIPFDGVDVVVSNAVQIGLCNEKIEHTQLKENHIYTGSDYIKISAPVEEWFPPAWLNLYNRKFLLDNDLFFVKGRIHEDVEILPRVFLNAQRVAYLNYAFYNYVVRTGSIMTSIKKEKSFQSSMLNYIAWKKMFDKVEDKKLQSILYGVLIKWYLKACRDAKELHPTEILGMTGSFMLHYSLNARERIKVCIFLLSKKLYYSI